MRRAKVDANQKEIVTITITKLAPGPNGPKGLLNMHWRARHRLKDMWLLYVLEQRPSRWKAATGVAVHITRHSSGKEMDPDNLYASCKFVLDALVRGRIIVDDSPEHITLTVSHEKAKRGEGKTIISIAEKDHD